MTKKPGAIIHMMRWGFSSGLLLVLLFVMWVASEDIMEIIRDTSYLNGVFYLAFNMVIWLFGALPGTVIGYCLGLVLYALSWKTPVPFTREDMQHRRFPVFFWMFIYATIISGVLIFAIIQMFSLEWIAPVLYLVPFLIAIISTYASHRYLLRLHRWSHAGNVQKSKAKNDDLNISRLTQSHSDNLPDNYQPDHQVQSETKS